MATNQGNPQESQQGDEYQQGVQFTAEQIKEVADDAFKQQKSPKGDLSAVIEETASRARDALFVEVERFNFQQRKATMFAISGLFSAQKGVTAQQAIAQAMIKIELGKSMGFEDAEALQGIYVINGVTAIASALRAARMQAAGYGWEIQWHGTEDVCTGCTLWMKFKGQPMMMPKRNDKGEIQIGPDSKPIMEQAHVSFKEADAKKMLTTLWENGNKRRASILEKDNWKMSPRNMYFARAVTNAQRFYAPGVLSANLLSVEEAQDLDVPSYAESTPSTTVPQEGGDTLRDRVAAAAGKKPEPKPATEPKAETKTAEPVEEKKASEPTESKRPETASDPAPKKPTAEPFMLDSLPDPMEKDYPAGQRAYVSSADKTEMLLFEVNADRSAWTQIEKPAKAKQGTFGSIGGGKK